MTFSIFIEKYFPDVAFRRERKNIIVAMQRNGPLNVIYLSKALLHICPSKPIKHGFDFKYV